MNTGIQILSSHIFHIHLLFKLFIILYIRTNKYSTNMSHNKLSVKRHSMSTIDDHFHICILSFTRSTNTSVEQHYAHTISNCMLYV
jgi:hypothetical protein